ncbi:hypothetical protein FN846DRAFT_747014 [Sphaerosporella brunnea]|uniref:Uncharacterized protein n=1 Tax=Sphaerosporella brunnea TaxID=1250544 RepID=A0A5J5EWK0_9PEZI|nr:hypothetical protein FN846DRAFT_747014 [Sphaerosporella brunnea]
MLHASRSTLETPHRAPHRVLRRAVWKHLQRSIACLISPKLLVMFEDHIHQEIVCFLFFLFFSLFFFCFFQKKQPTKARAKKPSREHHLPYHTAAGGFITHTQPNQNLHHEIICFLFFCFLQKKQPTKSRAKKPSRDHHLPYHTVAGGFHIHTQWLHTKSYAV